MGLGDYISMSQRPAGAGEGPEGSDYQSCRCVNLLLTQVIEEKSECSTLTENADRVRQKIWDLLLAEVARDRLIQEFDHIARARILAFSCKESGLWLHAYPAPALGTLLDPETFRIAVALRVGAKVFEPHKCSCGRLIDSLRLHGLLQVQRGTAS